ncbi:MAG: hypothetical protein DI498_10990 [Paracoccus denitrificans]|nr:MAG: hypothetical protein DI498_10990 [Paracoccus denitrificans]PZO83667.1 MAG: hypothetical protein DI633_10990 [Paracoccus denitrificans]
MQFKLAKTHRYWWPVTVRVPDPDNAGGFIEQQLKLQFEPQPRDEAIAAQEHLATLKTVREAVDHEVAQTLRAVRNWDGVVDEAGDPVTFSTSAFEAALQHSWFRNAVSQAIADSLNGEEARLGN